jgi:branched-chain amino acid transport system permease protein
MNFDDIVYFYEVYNQSIATALINSMMALSLYFSLRAGLFNLSAMGFMALGAYTSAILVVKAGWTPFAGMSAGVAFSLLVGTILIYPVLRLRGHYLAIATLSFGAIVQALAMNLDSLTNGPGGLVGVPVAVRVPHLIGLLGLLFYFCWIVQKSRVGRAIDAIRTDQSAARAMGIHVERYQLLALLVSTAIAALAGGCWAHVNRVVVPFEFGFSQLTFVLVNTLFGGISSPGGPILGALIVSSMPDWLGAFNEYRDIIIGLLLVAIVVYLPEGLISVVARGWRWLAGRKGAQRSDAA